MKVKTNLKAGWCKWPFEKCDPNQRGGGLLWYSAMRHWDPPPKRGKVRALLTGGEADRFLSTVPRLPPSRRF
jgi:hypothetical protein